MIQFMGGVSSGTHTTWADTPPGTHTPGTHPQHTPLLACTHPPAHPPGRQPPGDGHCSGRYASYWNAFLLIQHSLDKFNFVLEFFQLATVCKLFTLEVIQKCNNANFVYFEKKLDSRFILMFVFEENECGF